MRRKIVLCAVLCLAVATLGIAAAPALAADGCTCHTADPPTAAAAHAPFVAGLTDCTTCHVAWVVPHPTVLEPRLLFKPSVFINDDGTLTYVLDGRLAKPNRARSGINGVIVYLQERESGAIEYADVGQVTTQSVFLGNRGNFRMFISSTAKGMVYRAVAQGRAGSPVIVPSFSVARMTPGLTLKMRGLDKVGNMRLGRSVVALGRAAPTWFVGEKVRLLLVKGPDSRPRVVQRVERTIRDAGTLGAFRWKITPKTPGEYFVRATWPRTADHPRATAGEWFVTVK